MASMQFLKALREISAGLPILLLKSRTGELDPTLRVTAGEPWLAKPFSPEGLLLRVRIMLQHNGVMSTNSSTRLAVNDLELDEESREVRRSGASIDLTHTEFELLRFLMRNSHRVVTKQEILNRVWPYDFAGRVSVVELYVSYLRRKIDVGRQPLIRTLRHTGYILRSAGG
jgi:two-component system OmpR family response regulator